MYRVIEEKISYRYTIAKYKKEPKYIYSFIVASTVYKLRFIQIIYELSIYIINN